MIKGFIFDMDGTMVDNMMVHHRAWQRKLESLGLKMTLEEVRRSIHGINEEIIERLFGDRFTPADRRRIAQEKEAEYRHVFLGELKLIAGLDEFLMEASRLRIQMGIGTAAPPENVHYVIDNLNLHRFFEAVVDAGMVGKGKPEPDVFLKVADIMELPPEECLVFEDSPTGVEAARRAGMAAIVITTTHKPEEFAHFENVLRLVPNFEDLQPATLVEM